MPERLTSRFACRNAAGDAATGRLARVVVLVAALILAHALPGAAGLSGLAAADGSADVGPAVPAAQYSIPSREAGRLLLSADRVKPLAGIAQGDVPDGLAPILVVLPVGHVATPCRHVPTGQPDARLARGFDPRAPPFQA